MKEFDNEEEFMRDGGSSAAAKNLWFFECAWEVANKGKYRQKKKWQTNVCVVGFNFLYFTKAKISTCISGYF